MVEQRDEAILDRLAGQTLADLRDHLLAALRQRLQALRAREDRGAASTELLPPSSGYELATTFIRKKWRSQSVSATRLQGYLLAS